LESTKKFGAKVKEEIIMTKLNFCAVCGGELEYTVTPHFERYSKDVGVVAFEDVPAQQCQKCGEEFYSIKILKGIDRVIQQKIKAPKKLQIEIPLFPRTIYLAESENIA